MEYFNLTQMIEPGFDISFSNSITEYMVYFMHKVIFYSTPASVDNFEHDVHQFVRSLSEGNITLLYKDILAYIGNVYYSTMSPLDKESTLEQFEYYLKMYFPTHFNFKRPCYTFMNTVLVLNDEVKRKFNTLLFFCKIFYGLSFEATNGADIFGHSSYHRDLKAVEYIIIRSVIDNKTCYPLYVCMDTLDYIVRNKSEEWFDKTVDDFSITNDDNLSVEKDIDRVNDQMCVKAYHQMLSMSPTRSFLHVATDGVNCYHTFSGIRIMNGYYLSNIATDPTMNNIKEIVVWYLYNGIMIDFNRKKSDRLSGICEQSISLKNNSRTQSLIRRFVPKIFNDYTFNKIENDEDRDSIRDYYHFRCRMKSQGLSGPQYYDLIRMAFNIAIQPLIKQEESKDDSYSHLINKDDNYDLASDDESNGCDQDWPDGYDEEYIYEQYREMRYCIDDGCYSDDDYEI